MLSNEFEANITRQIAICENMLITKGQEYAAGSDRLHNFRISAELQGITMRQALSGMMAKHTTSVYDMLNDEEKTFSREMWDEKITDHINYLLILQAVLYEERSSTKDKDI